MLSTSFFISVELKKMLSEINFLKDFTLSDCELLWMNEPSLWKQCDKGLYIEMDEKHDFWRKTYYTPEYCKNDGHFLYKEFGFAENVMAETSFDLNPIHQFDQAGLMVYLDDEHWLKTGIEHVDGENRMSCVVTNRFSDWSTQTTSCSTLEMRVYKMKYDYVVEIRKDTSEWRFIRICHLNKPDSVDKVKIGLYTCSPKASGGSVTFKNLKYKNVDTYHHSN